MKFLTDDEFVTQMRARFASKPYAEIDYPGSTVYWTDARYEALISDVLATYRAIRAAATADKPAQTSNDLEENEYDKRSADWGVWFIVHQDVGAYPTEWHRIHSALESCARSARHHERARIAKAIQRDVAQRLGPTTMELVASVIVDELPD